MECLQSLIMIMEKYLSVICDTVSLQNIPNLCYLLAQLLKIMVCFRVLSIFPFLGIFYASKNHFQLFPKKTEESLILLKYNSMESELVCIRYERISIKSEISQHLYCLLNTKVIVGRISGDVLSLPFQG